RPEPIIVSPPQPAAVPRASESAIVPKTEVAQSREPRPLPFPLAPAEPLKLRTTPEPPAVQSPIPTGGCECPPLPQTPEPPARARVASPASAGPAGSVPSIF